MLVLLIWEIYEVCRCYGLRWNDVDAKFHKDQLRCSEINRRGFTYTQTYTGREQGDHIRIHYFILFLQMLKLGLNELSSSTKSLNFVTSWVTIT
jgi:hypothetical protein